MTTDEVKAILEEVRCSYRRYLLAREKAASFRDGFLSPPVFSDMPHSSSRANGTENRLISLAGCDEEAAQCLERYLEARKAAERMIEYLTNPDEKEVLTRRYILFEKWSKAAKNMCFSEGYVHRLHNSAIQKLVSKC